MVEKKERKVENENDGASRDKREARDCGKQGKRARGRFVCRRQGTPMTLAGLANTTKGIDEVGKTTSEGLDGGASCRSQESEDAEEVVRGP